MGFNLGSANTKLAIYYNCPRVGGGGRDTLVNYFFFTTVSAAANYIKRNYAGTLLEASVGGALPDPFVYLQNSPGTFATIKIPDLANLSNRVIHRAELIAEEVYHPSDTLFRTPDYLYLDAYDPSISKFRTIPYDLLSNTAGILNLAGFGIIPVTSVDGSGNKIKTWHFNISRYVQHVLTHTQTLYDLRLLAPFILKNQYGIPPGADFTRFISINPTIVKGRVRLAGGVPGPQRMRIRIIYSKL